VLLFAQQIENDTVYELSAIEISSSRLEAFRTGQKIIALDSLITSLFKADDIGQLLSRNTALHIRSYNGLSSISFRGTAAHHTGIFWNGFALNPSNIGMINLALIPGGYFTKVKVLYGGSSSLYGSGNIGGSIHLGNLPDFIKQRKGRFAFTLASFSEYNLTGNVLFASKSWYSATSVLIKTAQNNFPYNTLSGETERMKNNATKQGGIMQDVFRKYKNATLGGSFWYQYNHKEIPASLTEKPNDAWQEDQSFRTVLSWVQTLCDASLSVKGAYFYDKLNYVDPAENLVNMIDSKIETNKTSIESEISKNFTKNSVFKAGTIFINDQGVSNNWNGKETRQQLGLFAYWLQSISSIEWTIDIKLRQDFTQGYKVPFTPALGLEGKIYKNLFGKLSISRNFRVPTFNDLFWIGQGNENLNPESSWNEEIGLAYEAGKGERKVAGKIELTSFSSQVDDWILWIPDGSIFRPENIQKVWSRGIELDGGLKIKLPVLLLDFSGGYSFVKSTNEISRGIYDAAYKKQLIYTPEQRYFINATLSCKTIVFSYNHSYTGLQYVSSDNLERLPAYFLGNLSLQKTFTVLKQHLTSQFEVLNIWDVEYQSNRYFPMPGRSFKFSILISFN
jgi:iron complex outermembrane receptor protein